MKTIKNKTRYLIFTFMAIVFCILSGATYAHDGGDGSHGGGGYSQGGGFHWGGHSNQGVTHGSGGFSVSSGFRGGGYGDGYHGGWFNNQ